MKYLYFLKADFESEVVRSLVVNDKLFQEYIAYRYAQMPQHKLETLKSTSLDFEFHDKYKVPRKILSEATACEDRDARGLLRLQC